MLGGSGSINGMAYIRGNYRDYDNWEALGAKGWSWKDVFSYFLKLEDNRNWEYLANGKYFAITKLSMHLEYLFFVVRDLQPC